MEATIKTFDPHFKIYTQNGVKFGAWEIIVDETYSGLITKETDEAGRVWRYLVEFVTLGGDYAEAEFHVWHYGSAREAFKGARRYVSHMASQQSFLKAHGS